MLLCRRCNLPSLRGAFEKTDLYKVGFIYILDGPHLFPYRDCNSLGTDRTAIKIPGYDRENPTVKFVKAELVDLHHGKRT